MKSDEDYFSRNMTYFNVFLRILRLGKKYTYFTVFYNGFERTEQLCRGQVGKNSWEMKNDDDSFAWTDRPTGPRPTYRRRHRRFVFLSSYGVSDLVDQF